LCTRLFTIRVHGYEVVCALTRDGLFVYVI
jgi:hypothetical protein